MINEIEINSINGEKISFYLFRLISRTLSIYGSLRLLIKGYLLLIASLHIYA